VQTVTLQMLWLSELALLGLTTLVITAALFDALRERRKQRRKRQP